MPATYSFIEGLKTTRRSFEDETPHEKFPADLVTFTEEIFSGKLHFCAMREATLVYLNTETGSVPW